MKKKTLKKIKELIKENPNFKPGKAGLRAAKKLYSGMSHQGKAVFNSDKFKKDERKAEPNTDAITKQV